MTALCPMTDCALSCDSEPALGSHLQRVHGLTASVAFRFAARTFHVAGATNGGARVVVKPEALAARQAAIHEAARATVALAVKPPPPITAPAPTPHPKEASPMTPAPPLLTCKVSGCSFRTRLPAGLGRHMQCKHPATMTAAQPAKVAARPKPRRWAKRVRAGGSSTAVRVATRVRYLKAAIAAGRAAQAELAQMRRAMQ